MSLDKSDIINRLVNDFGDEFFWYQDQKNGNDYFVYSDSVLNVTGYTNEEMLAMPDKGKDIIVDDDLKLLKQKVDEFKKDVDSNRLNFEFRINRKDNTVVWVTETMIVERNDLGDIVSYFGRVLDISSFKSKEESLKKDVDELGKINSSKDSFISMLSHDLRAPFTSILGFSEILMNDTDLSEKERTEYLSYINDSSQNQLQLINDLLDWSRLQTGRLKIEPQRVRAQRMVFNSVSSLTGDAIRKNIDIKVNVPDNLYVEVDERLLTQTVTNLLGNAIKFSTENTSVTINAGIFNEKFSEIVIKDEGIGIPDANQEKLLKPGKIFTTEGTKGEKGTGLGLALTKEIIEKHSGEIWFYSTPGKGSEFHITVPSSPNTILLVKHSLEKREKYLKLLRNRFPMYQVIGAENGYNALGIILSQMPFLIITEHEMPLMNGDQLIKSIKRKDKSLDIPVFVLDNGKSDDINKIYSEQGIETFPDEPLDIDKLEEKLQAIIH
jgi:two-component system sensor histidine kinase/response regulator